MQAYFDNSTRPADDAGILHNMTDIYPQAHAGDHAYHRIHDSTSPLPVTETYHIARFRQYVAMFDWSSLVVFMISMAIVSWSSARLTVALERMGARFRFSDGLLGIITALGSSQAVTGMVLLAILTSGRMRSRRYT